MSHTQNPSPEHSSEIRAGVGHGNVSLQERTNISLEKPPSILMWDSQTPAFQIISPSYLARFNWFALLICVISSSQLLHVPQEVRPLGSWAQFQAPSKTQTWNEPRANTDTAQMEFHLNAGKHSFSVALMELWHGSSQEIVETPSMEESTPSWAQAWPTCSRWLPVTAGGPANLTCSGILQLRDFCCQ